MKPTLSDLPARYQAQALAQLSAVRHPVTARLDIPEPTRPAKKAAPRIRQNAAGLNKTEAAFQAHLQAKCAASDPRGPRSLLPPQSITLRLANGCRYTPDFITVQEVAALDSAGYASAVCAYEVKGFMRDDAAVKLKVAAALFPWIAFHLVTRAAGGGWNVENVLP